MNELDARRKLLADPHSLDPRLEALLRVDPRLAAYRDELVALDEGIHRLVARSPVPDGLAERLILHARYRRRTHWGLGIAAALVVITLATRFVARVEEPALEDAMIAHVVTEAGELQDDRGIQPAALRTAVSEIGVRVRETGYRFRHLGRCIVAGRESRHFTIDGPHGTVTFLVVPGHEGGGDPVLLESHGTRGLFMKRDGSTIGVFAAGGASRAELERLFDAVIA